tara:strand:+ start:5889 stop:6584 length:696 start_codon:yes stop_codon:yes gene_type:complete
MSVNTNNRLAVIAGAGQGLGKSIAIMLAKAGYHVIGLNRSEVSCEDSNVTMMQLDVASGHDVANTLSSIIEQFGAPEVLIHNPAELLIKPFQQTSPEDFELAWKSMVLSAVNIFHTVLPAMVDQGKGTILVSGATASLRAGANFSAFASAKFALRGLTQSVAREYQKQGIHIAHVVLDGILDTPNSRTLHSLDPDDMMSTHDVAEAYLQLIQQKPSAWSHEIDLRPKNEIF